MTVGGKQKEEEGQKEGQRKKGDLKKAGLKYEGGSKMEWRKEKKEGEWEVR